MKMTSKVLMVQMLLLLFGIFLAYSQIRRTQISVVNGIHTEEIHYTLPLYQITDSIVEKELNYIFNGFSSRDSALSFLLDVERIDSSKVKYSFNLMFSRAYGEDANGFFRMRGLDVIFFADKIPDFMYKTSKSKEFTYRRRFCLGKDVHGNTCELGFLDEDDGETWELIFENNHFTVVSVP